MEDLGQASAASMPCRHGYFPHRSGTTSSFPQAVGERIIILQVLTQSQLTIEGKGYSIEYRGDNNEDEKHSLEIQISARIRLVAKSPARSFNSNPALSRVLEASPAPAAPGFTGREVFVRKPLRRRYLGIATLPEDVTQQSLQQDHVCEKKNLDQYCSVCFCYALEVVVRRGAPLILDAPHAWVRGPAYLSGSWFKVHERALKHLGSRACAESRPLQL